MQPSDWSQLIPDIVAGIVIAAILAIAGGIITYFKSERFREWLRSIVRNISNLKSWLLKFWQYFLLTFSFLAFLIVLYLFYSDWKIIAFITAFAVLILLASRLLIKVPAPAIEIERDLDQLKRKFLPIPLHPGVGNSYLKSRYLDPPFGNVVLGGVEFQILQDSLIFDTAQHISSSTIGPDGGIEVELVLKKTVNGIRSAFFLLNSGNSLATYEGKKFGEIRLLFSDAPPLTTELVLGRNVREWCPGNTGDLVREISVDSSSRLVWKGMNKQGTNAIIDCLEIPIYEVMRKNALEKIVFVHLPLLKSPDRMGVHFSVFAISLELETDKELQPIT